MQFDMQKIFYLGRHGVGLRRERPLACIEVHRLLDVEEGRDLHVAEQRHHLQHIKCGIDGRDGRGQDLAHLQLVEDLVHAVEAEPALGVELDDVDLLRVDEVEAESHDLYEEVLLGGRQVVLVLVLVHRRVDDVAEQVLVTPVRRDTKFVF